MGRICDLPPLERPREKAFRYGIETLSNVELIALLIGSGTKGHSAIDIAHTLLSEHNGLFNLSKITIDELSKTLGLKSVGAMRIKSAFELNKRMQFSIQEIDEQVINSEFLFRKYYQKLCNEEQELFVIILLNKHHKIICEKILYKGTDNNIPFSFRDVYKIIFQNNAYFYFIIHNHPGGKLMPSSADELLTEELMKETNRINVILLDHLIISRLGYYSFIEQRKHFLDKNLDYKL